LLQVLLNYDEHGDRHVGYIANVHTQAFQGSEAVLLSQLTDIMIFVSLFKEKKTQPRDIIDFDVVCGDFNADNMSPGKVILSVKLWPIQPYTLIRLNFTILSFQVSTVPSHIYSFCFFTTHYKVVTFLLEDSSQCRAQFA
jgi:hypothetical protein